MSEFVVIADCSGLVCLLQVSISISFQNSRKYKEIQSNGSSGVDDRLVIVLFFYTWI